MYLGLGGFRERQLAEERDEQMRSRYLGPVEQFPDKIDQLLDALNRVGFIEYNTNAHFFIISSTWISKGLHYESNQHRQ
jgi:hypothetical protein